MCCASRLANENAGTRPALKRDFRETLDEKFLDHVIGFRAGRGHSLDSIELLVRLRRQGDMNLVAGLNHAFHNNDPHNACLSD